MNIEIKTLNEKAVIPTYGTEKSAGADLRFVDGDTTIQPGETKLLHTGVAMAIPDGYVGLIFARSGLATKKGLAPANKVGVVDADYRGEIMVALHNHSDKEQTIQDGERIAQISFIEYEKACFVEVDNLDETERGSGGYGSTGTR